MGACKSIYVPLLIVLICAVCQPVSCRYWLLQESPPVSSSGLVAFRNILEADAGNCTPPRTEADTQHPFCFLPNTVSPQARRFLSRAAPGTTLLGAADPVSSPGQLAARLAKLRQFAAQSSRPLSEAAVQQHLQGTRNDSIGGVPVVFGIPKGNKQDSTADTRLLFYLHGGGYAFGSCYYMLLVAPVAAALGATLLCPEYRLAPEHPFPAGLNDVATVYKTLIQQKGYNPKNIVFMGDSAGGGMVPAMTIQLQREGVPLPAALGMGSPWVELQGRGDCATVLIGADPTLGTFKLMGALGKAYVGGSESLFADPLVSPYIANYSSIFAGGKLPPSLIQVGMRELLLSDAVLLYQSMKTAAPKPGHVMISPWEGMWHGFQYTPELPEAQAARRELVNFFKLALDGSLC